MGDESKLSEAAKVVESLRSLAGGGVVGKATWLVVAWLAFASVVAWRLYPEELFAFFKWTSYGVGGFLIIAIALALIFPAQAGLDGAELYRWLKLKRIPENTPTAERRQNPQAPPEEAIPAPDVKGGRP